MPVWGLAVSLILSEGSDSLHLCLTFLVQKRWRHPPKKLNISYRTDRSSKYKNCRLRDQLYTISIVAHRSSSVAKAVVNRGGVSQSSGLSHFLTRCRSGQRRSWELKTHECNPKVVAHLAETRSFGLPRTRSGLPTKETESTQTTVSGKPTIIHRCPKPWMAHLRRTFD